MHPESTDYLLCTQPNDYSRCHALMTRLGLATDRLGWPTVMAIRDGALLGFLATQKRDDAVVAGPLVLAQGSSPYVLIRLVEAYDVVMRAAGIQFYMFHLEAENMKWKHIIEKLSADAGEDLELLQADALGAWYKRRVTNGQLESSNASA